MSAVIERLPSYNLTDSLRRNPSLFGHTILRNTGGVLHPPTAEWTDDMRMSFPVRSIAGRQRVSGERTCGLTVDSLYDFLNWAWERHHNPLSWYIRPLFVLPFCYFAYKKNVWGVLLTLLGVVSSMFWFPAPAVLDARAAEFLAMERQYVTGGWTVAKTAMAALVPVWFIALTWAFWRRSWLAGASVINVGALLKIIWGFYFGGDSAWSILPAVGLGALISNGVLLYAYRRVHRQALGHGYR